MFYHTGANHSVCITVPCTDGAPANTIIMTDSDLVICGWQHSFFTKLYLQHSTSTRLVKRSRWNSRLEKGLVSTICAYIRLFVNSLYNIILDTSNSGPSEIGQKISRQETLLEDPNIYSPYSFNTFTTSEKRTTSLQRTKEVNFISAPMCPLFRGSTVPLTHTWASIPTSEAEYSRTQHAQAWDYLQFTCVCLVIGD